jgi:hypothetical protein
MMTGFAIPLANGQAAAKRLMVFGLWTALCGHGGPGIERADNVRSPREVKPVLAEAERAGGTIVRPAARAAQNVISGFQPHHKQTSARWQRRRCSSASSSELLTSTR